MLRTRVVTALVLLGLFLPCLFYLSQVHWALLMAAVIGVGAWEWGGILRWSELRRRLLGILMASSCAGVSLIAPEAIGAGNAATYSAPWVVVIYVLAAAFWCLLIPLWLRMRWALGTGAAGLLTGLVVLFPTWLAMVQLRTLGPAVLLALFAVVWVADVAAYFSGKAFGKHKLAPSISPGKTWEGAIGAVVAVIAYGLTIRFSTGYAPLSLPLWVLALILVTAVSIIGDLYESMLKRQAGIKDSSKVLPGHGGVLDRIDSLTSTMPIVGLLWLITSGVQ
ncbi:MAG: phosphatidate cytidylyltransferase [Rhodocyclaceae bacterium]|nr:phosphatidate cytidylyltransferase [Rhodocyclaceae bacterium]